VTTLSKTGDEIAYAGVTGQAELIRNRELSSVELTEALLHRIDRLNPTLGAFRIVMREEALAEAAARDEAANGADRVDRGPLHGVPIAIKDEIDVAGQLTTFGTAAKTRPADQDSEIVRRLRAAGAVIIGKTAMPEFGQWPFTESSTYGYTRNPWDLARTPGGSSGGTASAVAAGLAAAGIGGDGGGSIRIPSACCGLFGLKATRGLISTAPHDSLWHALGTIGPLTRTVKDSALIYELIRSDAGAGTAGASFVEAATAEPGSGSKLRIAVSRRSPQRGIRLGAEQARALEDTAEALRGLGHEVVDFEPSYPEILPAFAPQVYGGVRDEIPLVERPDLLERRTKHALLVGRAFPPASVRFAIRHGERLSQRLNADIFERHDLLLTPMLPAAPRPIGALDGIGWLRASLRALQYVAYTAVWNVSGNPAASVPAGFTADGLPSAVQVIAPLHGEPAIFRVSAQLEAARPWADRRPPVR
jgi:amidase